MAEQTIRRIGVARVSGLFGLAVASVAEAVRLTAVDRGWTAPASGLDRALLATWVAGLLVFGISFGWMWVAARRLAPADRESLGDERAVFMTRRVAVAAFVATWLFAVVVSAVPLEQDLPGRAVALAVVAVGSGALAIGNLGEIRG